MAAADPRPIALDRAGHDAGIGRQRTRRAPGRHHGGAGNLQRAGVIRYRRGHISVLERSGLETRACECYAVVRKELTRLLSDVQYRQGPSAIAI